MVISHLNNKMCEWLCDDLENVDLPLPRWIHESVGDGVAHQVEHALVVLVEGAGYDLERVNIMQYI